MSDPSLLVTRSGPGTPSGRETKEQVVIRATEPDMDNRFLIIGEIGAGGMNRIYEGRDSRTGSCVALRAFENGKTLEEGPRLKRMKRMEREVKLLKELDHPNFPKFLGQIVDKDGDGYIVLELVRGKELTSVISSAALASPGIKPRGSLVPWKTIHEVIRQLLQALDKMHSLRMIHRDIKPGNIMYEVGSDGAIIIKVIDFGLGKSLEEKGQEESLTREGDMMGSAEYMAPEQLTNAKWADQRADLYAVGAVLYEMVTGHKPVDLVGVSTNRELVARLIGELSSPLEPSRYPREFVEDMNPHLEQLILDLLERNPDKRPQSAAETLRRFELAMDSGVRQPALVMSDPPPPLSNSRSSVRPSRSFSPPSREKSKARIVILAIVALSVTCVGVFVAIKVVQAPTVKNASPASTTTERSPIGQAASASAVVTAPPPVASTVAPQPVPTVIPTVASLTAPQRAVIERAKAELRHSGTCSTLRQLMKVSDDAPNFPDTYYYLAECTARSGAKSSETYYRNKYVELSGGRTAPP